MSLLKHSSALAIAGIIEYATQLLLPIVLVRNLSVAEFGEYRFVWLISGTALAIFPFFMPWTLFYFLPRLPAADRPKLIGNTIIFLTFTGFLAAALLWVSAQVIQLSFSSLITNNIGIPVFVALWVMASLSDTVAVADNRAILQARVMIFLSLVRTVALAAAAISIGDLGGLIFAMCIFAGAKFGLAIGYGAWIPNRQGIKYNFKLMRKQLVYAAPFAIGNGLYLIRGQADQWVVASLFSPDVFALISIAAVVMGLTNMVRQPIRSALLPQLGRLLTNDKTYKASIVIAQSNSAMAVIVLPFLSWLFVCTPELISLVYTEIYRDAAPLMQLYIIGLAASVIGGGYLLSALDAGRVVLTINLATFIPSIILSYIGAKYIGLYGAVTGSITSLVIGEIWALIAVAKKLGCSVWDLCETSLTARIYGAVICSGTLALLGKHYWTQSTFEKLITGSTIYFINLVFFIIAFRLHRDIVRLCVDLRSPLQ